MSVGRSDFDIIVNTQGGFFNSLDIQFDVISSHQYDAMRNINSNTEQWRVGTMIHELAHYSGAAGMTAEKGQGALTQANNALVWDNCSTTIQRFSNVQP
jgi:hypothetical protein